MTPERRAWQDGYSAGSMNAGGKTAGLELQLSLLRKRLDAATKELRAKKELLKYYQRKIAHKPPAAEARLPLLLVALNDQRPVSCRYLMRKLGISEMKVIRSLKVGMDLGKIVEVRKGRGNVRSLYSLSRSDCCETTNEKVR